MTPAREDVTLDGRRLVLVMEGPDAARRFSVSITDVATGHSLTRAPVRGRSPADARDRALEVAHNLLSIERLQDQVLAIAAELAPGATVELTEDAQAIIADLRGAWSLDTPLAVPRDDVIGADIDPGVLAARIRAHFEAHLRPSR